MIGVTLRYTWITRAMFMGPGPEPVLPSGRYHKKCIYITRVGLLGGDKTHSPLCVLIIKKPVKRSVENL